MRLGELGHKATTLWHSDYLRNRLPKPVVQIPLCSPERMARRPCVIRQIAAIN
jgi:hypothetical protein